MGHSPHSTDAKEDATRPGLVTEAGVRSLRALANSSRAAARRCSAASLASGGLLPSGALRSQPSDVRRPDETDPLWLARSGRSQLGQPSAQAIRRVWLDAVGLTDDLHSYFETGLGRNGMTSPRNCSPADHKGF